MGLNSVLSICEQTSTCFKGAADVKKSIHSPPHRSRSARRCMKGNFIFKTLLWTSEVVFILWSRRERLHLVILIWRRVLAFEYWGDKSEHGAELNKMLTLAVRTLISHLNGVIPPFLAVSTGTHTHTHSWHTSLIRSCWNCDSLAKVNSALGLIWAIVCFTFN